MRLDDRRPGTSTTFIDSASGEEVLQVAMDDGGALFIAYHLYDECGALVAESEGLEEPHLGLSIRSGDGVLLLNIPADASDHIQYRLHGSSGRLLTHSDGTRTKIFPHLRMEGVGRAWAAHRHP